MSAKKNPKKLLFQAPPLDGEKETCKKDYTFETKLGDGAFGQVWKIIHNKSNKSYACKQVAKERVTSMFEQFRREVLIMYEITHPNIIKLFHHFEDDKYFYLVMEIAEGGSLFQKLTIDKTFIEKQANEYFKEILDAVDYLHKRTPVIIHRDIKPENILIGDQGHLKLTDFGWSNYYFSEQGTPRYTICGTFEYLSPEMVKETGHTNAVDIWCLGILLYEMLCGYTPFKAAGRDSLMENITKGKLKFPSTMSPLVKNLITKILEKNPVKRLSIEKIKQHEWYKMYTNCSIGKGRSEKNSLIRQSPTKPLLPVVPNSVIDSNKEVNLNSFRKSILIIKNELISRIEVMKELREKIKDSTIKIKDEEATVKVIEQEILEKKKEAAELELNHKVLYEKFADSTRVLEKLGVSHNLEEMKVNISMKKIEIEKKILEIDEKYETIQSMAVKINELDDNIIDKTRYFDNLKNYFAKLKSKGSTLHNTRKSQISDLQASYECLKSQIIEHEKQIEELETPENKAARGLMIFVKTNKNKIIENTLIEDKLDFLDEQICIKEVELERIKIEYLDQKKALMRIIRYDKEKILKKKSDLDFLMNKMRNAMSFKETLEEQLSNSRNLEIKYKLEIFDIQAAREKAKALKVKLNTLNSRINKAKIVKARMRNNMNERAGNIEDIEMELGMLKAEILMIDDI
ncbi:hypothetical protein SteCoe_484 [Stentor coeruleus]|uniref:Aurora kinase n=1 Tax=Stentor coeruleus TaxID=5963 RepID=A0A1R2D3V1_9CILI|nr:hypothetical protein SteCoe_484 [Stentor coeruleus]